MDTEQWKNKIETEIGSIDKQIKELKDAISQLEDYKAIFHETHRTIVAAEEKAGELNLLFELDSHWKPPAQLQEQEEDQALPAQERDTLEADPRRARMRALAEASQHLKTAEIDPDLQRKQLIPNFLRERLQST